jgi:hypothetical protein
VLQAKLFVLVSSSFDLIPYKFLKLLKTSGIASPHMIAAIIDQKDGATEWFQSKEVVDMLYDEGVESETFLKSYSEALDCSIIDIRDGNMIARLAEILKTPGRFTKVDVVEILKSSCGFANNYKRTGKFLCHFCDIFDMKGITSTDLISSGKCFRIIV